MQRSLEGLLQEHVADYLSLHYPDVPFHSDFGSGVKLTIGQAAKQKRQNGGRRAWPDMFIAVQRPMYSLDWIGQREPDEGSTCWQAGGLFLELKKEGTNLFAKRNLDDPEKKSIDGHIYVDKHVREQADVLYVLRQQGYIAEFAVGFDEAIKIIDSYLKEVKNERSNRGNH